MSIADRMSEMGREAPKKAPEQQEGGGDVAGHLKALHSKMGGKHMHVHSDGVSHTTHQVGEDGQVEGPHDHQNIEELKTAMDKFLSEEAAESSGPDGDEGLM